MFSTLLLWTTTTLVVLVLAHSTSHAFAPIPLTTTTTTRTVGLEEDLTTRTRVQSPIRTAVLSRTVTPRFLANSMESDFASAFPTTVNRTFAERILQQGDDFVRQVRGSLAADVAEPPELLALEEAVESNSQDVQHLSQCMYELMIECGLQYDKDPETGVMTPTQFDIPQNLNVPEVKKEFFHLYTYGMQLISMKLLTMDQVKTIAQERIIPRTGLEPQAFDEWLGF